MTITVYTFEDKDGNEESGCYTTQNYQEAKEYASRYRLKVIANEFEFSHKEEVDDFTDRDEEEETEGEETDEG